VKYESGEEELVGALMDVTATRETQKALDTARAELARVARVTALGQMSASIAHEVNQPLAAIATSASAGLRWLTREVPEIGEARACVNHIAEEANRASEIMRSIRDLARRADPEVIALDINAVIDETVALVKQEALNHRGNDISIYPFRVSITLPCLKAVCLGQTVIAGATRTRNLYVVPRCRRVIKRHLEGFEETGRHHVVADQERQLCHLCLREKCTDGGKSLCSNLDVAHALVDES
jgi:signal transduction histidine kinase